MINTFLRRYLRKPNRGDVSSYSAMAFRISGMPPLPRPSKSTSSRLAYLRRNLCGVVSVWVHQVKAVRGRQNWQPGEPPPMGAPWNLRYHGSTRHRDGPQVVKLNCHVRSRMRGCVRGVERSTYHPPGSAAAASYASFTSTLSKPLSDIAPVVRQRAGASIAV